MTAADGAVEGSQVSPLSAAHARRAAAEGVLEQKEKELMERCRAGVSRSERDAAARELEDAFLTYNKAEKDVDAEAEAAVMNQVRKIRDRLKVAPSKGQGGSSQVAARGHSGGSRTTLVVDKGVVPENDTAAVDTNKTDSSAAIRAPALPAPFHSLGSRSSRRGACLEDEEEKEREGGFELAVQQQFGKTSTAVKFNEKDDVTKTEDDKEQIAGRDIRKATKPPFGRVPASLDVNKKHARMAEENQGAAGHVSVHEKSVSELTTQKQQGEATDGEGADDTTAAPQHYPYHPSVQAERMSTPKPKLASAVTPMRAKQLNPKAPAFVPKALQLVRSEPATPGNNPVVPPSKIQHVQVSTFGGKEDVKSGSQPGPDDKKGLMTGFPSQAPPRPSPPGRPLPTPTSKEERGADDPQNKKIGGLSTALEVEQLTSKVITDSHKPADQLKRATRKAGTTADVIEELEHGFDDMKNGLEKSRSLPRPLPSGRHASTTPSEVPPQAGKTHEDGNKLEMTLAQGHPAADGLGEPHEPAAKAGDARKTVAGTDEAHGKILQLHDPERKDDHSDDQQNQKHSVVKKDINEVVTETQKIGAGLTLQHTYAGESAVGRVTIQNESPKTNKEQKVAGSVSGSNSKKAVEAMKMETITSGKLPEEQQAGSLATPTTSSGVPGTPFDPWCPVGVEQWSDSEDALVPYSDSSDAEVTPPKPLAPAPPPADDRGLDTAAHTGQAVRAEMPLPFRSGGIGSCGVGREGKQASGARPIGEEPGAGKLAGDPVGLAQLLSFTSNTRGNEARAKKVFENKLYDAKQGDF